LENEKVMKKFGLVGFVAVFVIILIAFSSFAALAQYETSKTSPFTISSSGEANIAQNTTVGGVSIVIAGTPSATGSVSTGTYTGNPQTGASIPSGVTLTGFVAITFNIAASDFKNATITLTYTSAEVSGINPPYAIYKYNTASNSYTKLDSVVDTSAKTITVTVASLTDPLLAIGGTTAPAHTSTVPAWTWVIIATVALVVIILVVLILHRRGNLFPSSRPIYPS
jgi:hypothetical protein